MDAPSFLPPQLPLYALMYAHNQSLPLGPPLAASASQRAPKPSSTSAAPADPSQERFYLTTAISYTNGEPHFGHAYEAVTSDVIARYHRAYGRKVFFLTGTDEHGQKVQQSAQKMHRSEIEHCDFYAQKFVDMGKAMGLSNDAFVRTTSPAHKRTATEMWRRVEANGDIELGSYEGMHACRHAGMQACRHARAGVLCAARR
jgi:methionyl-tRNA synthetase